MMSKTRIIKLVLLSLTSFFFLFALFVNMLSFAALDFGRAIGLFYKYNSSIVWSERDVPRNYTFGPIGWTFSVWGPIYIYQVVLLAFCWSLPFRRVKADGPTLCEEPNLLPNGFMIGHICSSLFNAAWILVTDREQLDKKIQIPMTVLLIGITVSLYCSLIFSYWKLRSEKSKIVACGRQTDFWLVVGLVQNGVSLYTGWVTVASFLNLEAALIEAGKLDERASSIGCFSGVLIVVVSYAVADLTILDKFTRYVFTPHIVVLWACAGSLVANYAPGSAVSIMTIVLVCLVIAALVVKVVLICVRSNSEPFLTGSQVEIAKKGEIVE